MNDLDAMSGDDIAARLAAPPVQRAAFLCAAASQGHAEAQAVYGQMLLDGVGVATDAEAAFGWFVKAAAQNHMMALNMVGRCYDLGWGVPIDKVRAAECYRVAAGRGLVEAMYNYATLLTLGHGVTEDKAAALALFRQAEAAGYAKAINYIGSFAEDGWACDRDLRHAASCYAQAAEAGDFRGAFNHARMLMADGRTNEAAVWLRRAADGGTPDFTAKMLAWLAAHDRADVRAAGKALSGAVGC
jgi:TPR repeat protein